MKTLMRLIFTLLLFSPIMLGGCGKSELESNIAPDSVVVSGTMTYPAWTKGDYYAVIYPYGTEVGPTGEIGSAQITGTGTTSDYSISVPPNLGSVYLFGFNDDDSSGDPDGVADGSGCSAFIDVGKSSVTGVDFSMAAQAFTNCPSFSTTVTISGTITYSGWVPGKDYFAVVYPQGTVIGPTGDIGAAFITGTGTTVSYSVQVPANSGSVYILGVYDFNGSSVPGDDPQDAGGCTAPLSVADTDVTGIDVTLTVNSFPGCPM